jgi:hypothetical protein
VRFQRLPLLLPRIPDQLDAAQLNRQPAAADRMWRSRLRRHRWQPCRNPVKIHRFLDCNHKWHRVIVHTLSVTQEETWQEWTKTQFFQHQWRALSDPAKMDTG